MFKKIVSFYKISEPSPNVQMSEQEQTRLYKRLRMQSFIAGTIGYSLYYVCRTTLNVVKKPILDSGQLDAHQLGIISSALLFAYAAGKFANGFLADHCNIKRFMATGLIISAAANVCVGVLGFASGVGFSVTAFIMLFTVMWGINGWSQSMGAAPAIIVLSRWFPLKERGTYYGFFSASHNLGEFLSFIFVGAVVGFAGWQWGFVGSSIAGVVGVIVILTLLHDTPESNGLPPVEVLSNEVRSAKEVARKAIAQTQKAVLKNPFVWLLAISSSCMYISRYAINGWGVLFLQETKGFSLASATQIISINALLGILGTVLSGWLSDRFFQGRRNLLALIFGGVNTLALVLFLYSGASVVLNVLSMVLFGIAIGVQICFLGGLMAVDIVPRNASGAALGVIGVASYIGAGLQDITSGWLLSTNKTVSGGIDIYDFSQVSMFWIGASLLSTALLLLFCALKKNRTISES